MYACFLFVLSSNCIIEVSSYVTWQEVSDLFSLLQFSNVHIPRSAASVRSLNCKKGGGRWLGCLGTVVTGAVLAIRKTAAGGSSAGMRLTNSRDYFYDIATAKLMAVQELESCRPPPGMSNSRPKEVCQKLLCQCL